MFLNVSIYRVNSFELVVEREQRVPKVAGYRIVEIDYLLQNVLSLQSNHSKVCTEGKINLDGEIKKGLLSQFIFVCNICNKRFTLYSENYNCKHPMNTADIDKQKESNANVAAVWGTLATGSTYAHLSELLSVLDIPTIQRKMFFKIQRSLSEVSV